MVCACFHGKDHMHTSWDGPSAHLARNAAAVAAEELLQAAVWSLAEQKTSNERRRIIMAILEGKKAIIIGDRDGIPGPAIAECVQTAGAEVVFSSTECFV